MYYKFKKYLYTRLFYTKSSLMYPKVQSLLQHTISMICCYQQTFPKIRSYLVPRASTLLSSLPPFILPETPNPHICKSIIKNFSFLVFVSVSGTPCIKFIYLLSFYSKNWKNWDWSIFQIILYCFFHMTYYLQCPVMFDFEYGILHILIFSYRICCS